LRIAVLRIEVFDWLLGRLRCLPARPVRRGVRPGKRARISNFPPFPAAKWRWITSRTGSHCWFSCSRAVAPVIKSHRNLTDSTVLARSKCPLASSRSPWDGV